MIGALMAKRLAGAVMDALSGRDFDAFLRDFAEDATFIYPGNVPASGVHKGEAGNPRLVRALVRADYVGAVLDDRCSSRQCFRHEGE